MGAILALKIDDARPLRRGNDHYWNTIRDLTLVDSKTPFSVPDILRRCDETVSKRTVRNFVQKLVARAVAEKAGTKPGTYGTTIQLFRLVRRPVDTPLLGSLEGKAAQYGRRRQQMWDTIRYQLKAGFTIDELVTFASTEDVEVTRPSAVAYVRALRNADVLLTVKQPRPHHAGTFRIKPSADTGPKAPKVLQAEIVFDANEQRIVSAAIATEAGFAS